VWHGGADRGAIVDAPAERDAGVHVESHGRAQRSGKLDPNGHGRSNRAPVFVRHDGARRSRDRGG
jgi:hypothetical protein